MDESIRLLVVDDEPSDVELVRMELRHSRVGGPFELEAAGTLAEAIGRLQARTVDVVLLDLGLPDAAGTSAVERLVVEWPETPVVVLTGADDEALGLRAVQQGAQDYLVKGRTDGALLQRSLRFAIERKRAEQALARLAAVMGALCYDCGRKLADDPSAKRYLH